MIRKIQRRWFEVWADEEAQNRLLKFLLLIFAALLSIQLVVICVLAFKKPFLVSLTNDSSKQVQYVEPDANLLTRELMRAILNYLKTRHNWEWTTIEARAKDASMYVASDFREKFLVSTQEQIRLAREKQISQRLYLEDPQIDMKAKVASVRADRILIVSGIRAAQSLKFQIGFSLGERTAMNPEGVYITSEKLETSE
jgi:hypothetical protein